MTDRLAWLGGLEQAALVARGEVSPLELVEAAISRIERLDPVLNCLVTKLYEKARAEAVSPGLPDGPFRGVPLLVKDFLCQTAGDPYYEGLGAARDADYRAPADSALAKRFRQAGFIILGRTNLPELANHPTTEPPGFPPTRNPWDPRLSPGGSSGGSAAAVACGMAPIAHANDGTGSIRIPASCCGLVGLKPSRGRVPDDGFPGFLNHVTQHVVTRTVRDSAAVLDAIVLAPPARPFLAEVGTVPGRLRIGWLTRDESIEDLRAVEPRISAVDPESMWAVERTARLLAGLGHDVEEASPPQLRGRSGMGGAAGVLGSVSQARHLDAWAARLGRTLGPEDVEPGTWAAAEQGRRRSADELAAARERMMDGICRVAEWWEQGWDLLLTPTMSGPPPRIGHVASGTAEERFAYLSVFGLHCAPYSYSGQPAISLPLHWTDGGLPVGVQLVAARGREDILLRVAAQLEAAAPWRERRPLDFS